MGTESRIIITMAWEKGVLELLFNGNFILGTRWLILCVTLIEPGSTLIFGQIFLGVFVRVRLTFES